MCRFDSALRESVGRKTQKQRKFKRDNKNKYDILRSMIPCDTYRRCTFSSHMVR